MANRDIPTNPAVRCVTSSKLPVCDHGALPIIDVSGSVDNNTNTSITTNTYERLTFNGTAVATNCVWDSATSQFLVQTAGNYIVSYDTAIDPATADTVTANSFIGINIAATGAAGNLAVPVRYAASHYAAGTDAANLSGSAIITLAVGDLVGSYISEDGATAGITLLAVGRLSIHALIGNFQ